MTESGRIRERRLISGVLAWREGDRTSTEVIPDGILIRRTPHGRHSVDDRQEVLVPAGARAAHGIESGHRVVLLALADRGQLVIHPVAWVASLVLNQHSARQGATDGRFPARRGVRWPGTA